MPDVLRRSGLHCRLLLGTSSGLLRLRYIDIYRFGLSRKFLDTGETDDVHDVVNHSEHFTSFLNVLEVLLEIFKCEDFGSSWLLFQRLRVLRRDRGAGLGSVVVLIVPVLVLAMRVRWSVLSRRFGLS